MTKSREFRARARGILGGDIFSNLWLMLILAVLIYSAIMSFGSATVVLPLLMDGFLMFGLSKILLSLVRGAREVKLEDLFSGTKQFADLFLLSFLKNLFILLWSLIPIAGIFISIAKHYGYSMAYYIKCDHPEYDWRRCLDESQKLMQGKKWRLFCLELSFLGWMIVGALCLGIGTLWVQAYMLTAEACFYEEICPKTENDGEGVFEIPHVQV